VTIVRRDPAVEHVVAFTGGGGATNEGFLFSQLKPPSVRRLRRPPGRRTVSVHPRAHADFSFSMSGRVLAELGATGA
jgi:hypothetical protein